MDFFTQQSRSRTRTLYLIGLFFVAVILVTAAVYAAVKSAIFFALSEPYIRTRSDFQWIDPHTLSVVSLITLAVVGLSSLIKIVQLSGGGRYVAESLGGRLVNRSSTDHNEKRLLNIVSEMAIASGVPVPQVYLLNKEEGINAFSAGYTPSDAVIAVTRGSMEKLNRDELQGVIAHEFSHILNGDMRLNVRLIGFLFGIMVIAGIGWNLLRVVSRTSSKKAGMVAALFASALVVIGYVGHLIGRIIQCAVCRQREFLADASAVQFTRNPTGIAGALKKIGEFDRGSRIDSRNTSEVSHLFFSSAVRSLFSTHPPLDERIRRIEPGFEGHVDEYGKSAWSPGQEGLPEFDPSMSWVAIDPSAAQREVGRITPEHMKYSAALLNAMPLAIKDELEDMLGSAAIVCAMLLSADPNEKAHQIQALEKLNSPEILQQTLRLEEAVKKIQPVYYLPALSIAIQTLRSMSPGQYGSLARSIQALVEADGKLTLFEFILKKLVTHQLGSLYRPFRSKMLVKDMHVLAPHARDLLSMLASSGHKQPEDARRAFEYGFNCLKHAGLTRIEVFSETVSFDALDRALDHLALAAPGIKRAIFDACCNCILFDKTVTISEAELLRATAAVMDIPVPPFLDRIQNER